MDKDIEEYFNEQYAKQSIKVVPGHHPDFESKEHIDKWIKFINRLFDEAFEDE